MSPEDADAVDECDYVETDFEPEPETRSKEEDEDV